jgi:hypothetical protein
MKDSCKSFTVSASLAAAHYKFLPSSVPLVSGERASVRALLENRTVH